MDLIGEERGRLARVAGWLDASRTEAAGLAILLVGTVIATVVVVWAALGRPEVLPGTGDGEAVGAAPGTVDEDGEVTFGEPAAGDVHTGHGDAHAGHGDARPGHEHAATPAEGTTHEHATASGDGNAQAGADSATASAEVVVHVVGAVGAPGVVAVPAGSRVADAIEQAGGLDRDADPLRLNLARPVVDGERVVVLREGEEPPEDLVEPAAPQGVDGAPPAGADGTAGGGSAAVGAPVDLNQADQATLETLPGIGPAIAGRIIAHREQHGPFQQPGDLRDVSGIGEKRFQDVAELVTVG